MDLEKVRAEFEAWFLTFKHAEPLSRNPENADEYEYLLPHVQWAAWYARAAIDDRRLAHVNEALKVANNTLAKFPR